MIIGIDARFYGPKQKGLGRYVQKLIEYLEKADAKNQYVIFLRRSNWQEYEPKNDNFKKVLADYPWYGFQEQIFFPLKILRNRVDLMHFPHFNVPIFYPNPYVVTIHDLVLKKYPTKRASQLSFFSYWFKNKIYHLVISQAVKRARKVVAISDYTKSELLKYFGPLFGKIQVVYEGAPDDAENIGNFGNDFISSNKYGISRPYLLYVGNAYPHKNLENLVISFKKLVQNEKMNLELVLVGEMDYFYKRLKKKIKERDESLYKRIIFTGFLSDDRLVSLYKNALLYVFPSMYEGFGLPPLEAMTYGAPVISSISTCLPEILGEAALYFNPEDIDEIVIKIKRVLGDQEIRKKLIKEGMRKAKKYKWQKMIEEILKIYQKALNQ